MNSFFPNCLLHKVITSNTLLLTACGLLSCSLGLAQNSASFPSPPMPVLESAPRPGQPTFDAVFTQHKVEINGVLIHYVEGGEGPPIVLLHGWAETWYTWRRVMPLLTAAGFTVVVPDLRGIGDSARPQTGYDKKTIATEIVNLMQQLGYSRFSVAGHDLGAQVAYALGRFHANRIKALAILDAPVAGIPPWDALKANPRLWHWTFYNVPDLPESLIGNGNEYLYFSWFYHQIAINTSAVDDDLDEIVRAYSQPGALRGGLAYFRAFQQDANDNAGYKENKIKVPVLAIGASGGNGTIPLQQMQLAADHIEGGLIENSGHWIPTEKPKELAARLIEFFRKAN